MRPAGTGAGWGLGLVRGAAESHWCAAPGVARRKHQRRRVDRAGRGQEGQDGGGGALGEREGTWRVAAPRERSDLMACYVHRDGETAPPRT